MKKYPTIPLLLALLLCLAALPAHAGRITYTYDTNARLTTADYGAETSIAYTYDAGGNLTRRQAVGQVATYTLDTDASPAEGGTVIKTPNKSEYNPDEVVQLTATPSEGYTFTNWSGDLSGTDNPANITMDANKSVTANFAVQTYTVTYDGNENTDGIAPVDGDSPYDADSEVTVLEPGDLVKDGFTFNNWNTQADGGGTSYDPGDTFTITENITLYAQWIEEAYSLTVTDGTGGGRYPAGKVVPIAANPEPGKIFSGWTGTGADHVANANNPNTTVTMPGADITVKANHKDQPDTAHTLTVTDGTGGGEYKEGTVVNIAADPREDEVFDKWTGNTTHVANVNIPNTSVIMPDSDVTVTATYTDKQARNVTLTVTDGTGGGSYPAGRVIRITADDPPANRIFDIWTGDTARISDVNDPDTTITMPDANVAVSATYRDKPNDPFTLTVNEGTGDGSYLAGTVNEIKATIPGDQIFDKWTGQTGRVANPNLPDTSVTMPASNVTVTATFMVKPDQSFTLEQRAYKENQAGDAALPFNDLVRASTRQAAGEKDPGAWHTISAPNEPGYDFFGWEGQTGNVEDVSSQSTRIYMPASNVTLVAVYTPQQGPAPTAIPTLSEWTLILMSVLMLITGLIMHRRRKQGLI